MNRGPLKPYDSKLDLFLKTQAEKRTDVQPLDRFNKTLRKITVFTLPLLTPGWKLGGEAFYYGGCSELDSQDVFLLEVSAYLRSHCSWPLSPLHAQERRASIGEW